MCITYRQLTQQQRYQIEGLITAGFNQSQIAVVIGCHRSTISRELSRCPGRRYDAKRADESSELRRRLAYKNTVFNSHLWCFIKDKLSKHLSPEMISGRLELEQHKYQISSSSIYRWVRNDWLSGGQVYQHLLRSLRPYRRAYGKRTTFDPLGPRASIHDRPEVVQARERLGDWEGDTVYLKGGYLVTLVDRAANYLQARLIKKRTKQITYQAIMKMIKNQPARTLTLDNGVEFAEHKRIAKNGNINIYFADLYASWQRGCNENTNGRLRRYIPRSTQASQLTPQQLRRYVEKMNHQPRKRLGWKTPFEVYNNQPVLRLM